MHDPHGGDPHPTITVKRPKIGCQVYHLYNHILIGGDWNMTGL